jgi:hypothetical protein
MGGFLLYPFTTLTEGTYMALADSIQTAIKEAPLNATCTVKKAFEKLSKEDRAVAETALYDRNIKASVLGRAFKKENIDITVSTITRHRNNGCMNCAR